MSTPPLFGPRSGRILVADDEEKNRRLLRDILEAQGHQVTLAEDGQEALDKAVADPPDVVLLDVMMPKMDGNEVCHQLRQDSRTAHLPILMVTALHDRADRLKGIQAGANDFLTKPIDPEEIRLRVRNAVLAKQLYDTVQEDYVQLKELETLRDNLVNMIIHDLRSPLAGMIGLMELIGGEDHASLVPEDRDDLLSIIKSGRNLLEMISSLLDVSRLEAGQMPVNKAVVGVRELAEEAVRSLAGFKDAHRVRLEMSDAPDSVMCDRELTRRIIANLLGNALKVTHAAEEVCLGAQSDAAGVRIQVRDMGCGIPAEYHQKIFEKFAQVEEKMAKKPHYSTGLGLTFCKLAVEAQGGVIGVQSEVGKGSTFWFTLPGGSRAL